MKKKNIILLIISVVFLLILAGIFFSSKLSFLDNNKPGNKNNDSENINDPDGEDIELPPSKLKIINTNSKTRTISVMIDNEPDAWPHAGLQDAYIIYEMIIEGGQTRMLALFKDVNTAMIGPIRSARHYYLDYALENDAIYTHFGFSPQAQSDISTLKVNNISGTQSDGSAFWREKPLGGWHNVFTSISNLTSKASSKGYRLTSSNETLLNYSEEEIDLAAYSGAISANDIRIDYSSYHYVTYAYDPNLKVYKRSMRGKAHTDRVTSKQYTFKNIIIYSVENYSLNDGSGKGRQGLKNIGSGTGYYLTNGYAIPIKWSKPSRTAQTIYTDLQGNEIKINDGNTIIQIQPLNKNRTIK